MVAFAASITKDITNFGTGQPLVFDQVTTNVGAAYDDRHGTFRAPISGIYQFSFTALQVTQNALLTCIVIFDPEALPNRMQVLGFEENIRELILGISLPATKLNLRMYSKCQCRSEVIKKSRMVTELCVHIVRYCITITRNIVFLITVTFKCDTFYL